MVRSGATGSKSENGSVVGSSRISSMSNSHITPTAVVKRLPGHQSPELLDAFKADGKVSSCSRGLPLHERICQVCKDVAIECPDGILCKCLKQKIEDKLLADFPKGADETEMAEAIFRFVKELASTGNLRAVQVMGTNLKPKEQRVLLFVRNHQAVVKKVAFCQDQHAHSKTPQQVEKDIPDWLKSELKISEPQKFEVSEIMTMYKFYEEFQPFLTKERDLAAEKAANGDKGKKSMNPDSDYVDKFFSTQKYAGDRAMMKAMLLMGCK